MRLFLGTLTAWMIMVSGCDGGLVPPDSPPVGIIRGEVHYLGTWPPADSFNDLRFVALPFIPRDTADLFRDLTRLVFSESLPLNRDLDTFVVVDVPAGTYVYSGVAQQFSDDVLDWRPLGLVEDEGGIFVVRSGETTAVSVRVDFADMPPFPPPQPPNP